MSSRDNLHRSALYLQVFDLLLKRISDGMWKPGSALPNEGDLARELGVSVGTVRRALDKLEEDRVITRQHGKGSFVLDQSREDLAFRFSKIVDRDGVRIENGRSTILTQEIATAMPIECRSLDLKRGDHIVRTRRVRSHGTHPSSYETACLAMERLAITSLEQVGDYVIVPLAQQQRVHLARASEKLTVVAASDEVAALLATEPRRMLLKLDRLIYDLDDRPLEWRIALCDLRDEYYVAEMR